MFVEKGSNRFFEILLHLYKKIIHGPQRDEFEEILSGCEGKILLSSKHLNFFLSWSPFWRAGINNENHTMLYISTVVVFYKRIQ